ncbi:PTS sugar transporter subunit IIA [Mycoplasmopsis agassizii]|uniref:PTS sugar transporter subunit IIA n=1 Tax=Mycoplasmopsis agassizii TaxID=33922 RepID=UPI0035296371
MEKDLIKISDQKLNWIEAIKEGVELLEKKKYCQMSYADSMIESTNKYGPYYVISPLLALAHALPEGNVSKVGLSLVLYKNIVNFSDKKEHQVQLLFTLCTTSPNDHIEMLQKFVTVFNENKDLTNQIINATTVDEIHQLLKEI